jgi:mRNA interferase RelE/StbE
LTLPIFDVEFTPTALKEWRKLAPEAREQLRKKLDSLRSEPRIASMRLAYWPNCYRIKLRKAGLRLVYKVLGERLVIVVVSVGRRDKSDTYDAVGERLKQIDDSG